VVVTAASGQDRDGAKQRLEPLRHRDTRWRHIGADGADAGLLVDGVQARRPHRPIRLELTTRSDGVTGVVVSPKRWIVARTFGWFTRDRRLRKDDARLPETSDAIIQVPMSHLMIRRVARIAPY
jgi:putative transposase